MPLCLPPVRQLTTILLTTAFVTFVLGCGIAGNLSKPKTIGTVKLNQELVFHDCKWIVTEVKDLGKTLTPTKAGEGEIKNTTGVFLLVRYKVTNTTRTTALPGSDPELLDDRKRTFSTLGDQSDYLPVGAKTMTDEDQIPSGITREFLAIYELPTDAKGLRLEAEAFEEKGLRTQKGYIELGR